MNILIPIAGSSTVLGDNQYIKSLYEIEKKIIIQHVYESLKVIDNANFIFVIRREDQKNFHLDDILRLLIPNVKIVISEGETAGSACSCLLAVDYIDNEEPLLISGGDQLILEDWEKIVSYFINDNCDGGVVCFEAVHPKWSYVRTNNQGNVVEAAEKRPISKDATTGQYYFKHGCDFISSIKRMIQKDANIEGEFYICPTFNEMILEQKKIKMYKISNDSYFSLRDKRGMDAFEEYLKGKKD